jgi:multiple RNA-binding domain-containing protein 1
MNRAQSTKLIIHNVPFEATKTELRELFGAYGQLKSVRIPKKFDGKHRGFAFVDYLTKQEATQAKEALGSTHLYGRHLVIEWAEVDEDLEKLRVKAGHDASKNADADRKAKRLKIG